MPHYPLRGRPDVIALKFRALIFSALMTSAFASATLDLVVSAAASFSVAIQRQLEMLQSNPSPTEFAAKTVAYAMAKTAYFEALLEELPELSNISTGKEERPPELDTFAAAFAVTGENEVKAADEATTVLLKQYSGKPGIQKARAEVERAQKVEEKFRLEFDRLGFTRWAPAPSLMASISSSFSSSLFEPSPTPPILLGFASGCTAGASQGER
jgi:hypothetical protein